MSFRRWFDSRARAGDEPPPLTEREAAIMEKIAAKVVEWKMTVPAILFLESVKPLNYIGAQAMVFFEPFVQALFNIAEYDTFREMMERSGIDLPRHLTDGLSDDQLETMVDVSLVLEPLWENALGKDWKSLMTREKIRSLYLTM